MQVPILLERGFTARRTAPCCALTVRCFDAVRRCLHSHGAVQGTLHLCKSAVQSDDAWTSKTCLVHVPMQCEDACICMEPCKERCTCASLRFRATMPGLLKTCLVYVPMQCDDACICMDPCKERCTCVSRLTRVMGNVYVFSRIKTAFSGALWLRFRDGVVELPAPPPC